MDQPPHPQVIRTWKEERIHNVVETIKEKDYLWYHRRIDMADFH